MSLPLLIGGVCIITSIIGTYFVRLGKGSIMGAMYKGFGVTAVLGAIPIYPARPNTRSAIHTVVATIPTSAVRDQLHRHGPVLLHAASACLTGLIVWITEYYTGTNYRPVQIDRQGVETGHGTNVIQGLAISLESTALPTLVI